MELGNVNFILFKLMILQILVKKTQYSIIVRYITDKSELVERFLSFHNVS